MGRRRLVVGALAFGAAVTAMPGWAAPSATAPTASAATYVRDVQLPASTVSAKWTKVMAGCGGRLEVSGPVVSGTTTIATGDLTTKWFRPHDDRLVSVYAMQGGDRHFTPFPEGFRMAVRQRARGHGWTPWWTMTMTSEPSQPPVPDLLVEVSAGVGFTLMEIPQRGQPLPVQQVQVHLVDRITSTATVDDEFGVVAGCR